MYFYLSVLTGATLRFQNRSAFAAGTLGNIAQRPTIMKRLLYYIPFLFLLTCQPTFSFAQERQNPKREYLSFDAEGKATISTADGWKFDSYSKTWVRNDNLIFQSNQEIDVTDYMKSNQCQTFKWIKLKSLKHNNKKYYVLLYERRTGHYKYPVTQDQWEIGNSTMFFIMDSVQYLNLTNVVDKKENKDFKITANLYGTISDFYGDYYEDYNDEVHSLLEKMWHTFQTPHKTSRSFIINSQTLNNENIIRFRLPEIDNCTDYSLFGPQLKISSSTGPGYFEVKQTDFAAMIISLK